METEINVVLRFTTYSPTRFAVMIEGGAIAVAQAGEFVRLTLDASKVRGKPIWAFPKKAILNAPSLKTIGQLFYDDTLVAEAKQIRASYNGDTATIKMLRDEYNDDCSEVPWHYKTRGPFEAMRHQRTMYKAIMATEACGILSDAGTCKTASYLWAVDERIRTGVIKKAVVITLSQLKKNVVREANMQVPGLRCVAVMSTKEMIDVMANIDRYDMVVTNYEAVRHTIEEIDTKVFDMVILDEAHRIGDPESQQTKAIMAMYGMARYKYDVTGSLSANSVMSFYMPYLFLGHDRVSISTYNGFRTEYLRCVDERGYVWVPKGHAKEVVKGLISNSGIGFKKSACLDLPGVIEIYRNFKMDADQRKAHDELKKELVTCLDDMCKKCTGGGRENCDRNCPDQTMIDHSLTLSGKLRQIAAGFFIKTMKHIDDKGKEIDDSQIVKIGGSPRLDCLGQIIDEIGENKTIVWVHHTHVVKEVVEYLRKKGRKVIAVYGNVDAFEAVDRFGTDEFDTMVAMPKKAGVGLNIQFSWYNVWYTDFYSYLEYDQGVSRQDRQGQVNKVTTYHIVADGSIDEVIVETLRRKGELMEYLHQAAVMFRRVTGKKREKAT